MTGTTTGLSEEAFFLEGPRGQRLFGILHRAAAPARRAAIIYCSAILEEKLNCHRIGVNFARRAAAEGFDVLRFDYAGDGESSGEFADASVTSRVEDIVAVASWISEAVRSRELHLVGLRFGAALALLAAEAMPHVSRVVCWAPILQGGPYLFEALRANLTSQVATYSKVIRDRNSLVADIQAGSTVDVDGWEIGKELYEEAGKVDFHARPLATHAPVFAVRIAPKPAKALPFQAFLQVNSGMALHVEDVEELEFWKPQSIVYPACNTLFEQTLAWLREPLLPRNPE